MSAIPYSNDSVKQLIQTAKNFTENDRSYHQATTTIFLQNQNRKMIKIFRGANEYIGDVRVYTSFQSFFTWLFGISMRVKFSDRSYVVDKTSYESLLRNRLRITSNISQYKDFSKVPPRNQRDDSRPMLPEVNYARTHLTQHRASQETQNFYRQSLMSAIIKGDQEKALKFIAKGADINKPVFYEAAQGYFDNIALLGEAVKKRGRNETISYTKSTPIAVARKLSRWKVVDFLLAARAQIVPDEIVTLEPRTIVQNHIAITEDERSARFVQWIHNIGQETIKSSYTYSPATSYLSARTDTF